MFFYFVLFSDKSEWDIRLKAVVYALNTSRQSIAEALPYDVSKNKSISLRFSSIFFRISRKSDKYIYFCW